MIRIKFLFALLLVSFFGSAQQAGFKLFLVGDAGENMAPGPALQHLHARLQKEPNSAVIFLGDNSYKNMLAGIISKGFKGYDGGKKTSKKIKSQIDGLMNYGGAVYFIPGNHDWWNRTNVERGIKKLNLEASFIEETVKKSLTVANRTDAVFLPAYGSPGPVSRTFNNGKLKVIFIDTQRLLLAHLKKTKEDVILLQRFYADFDSMLKKNSQHDQEMVVVAHHPVFARGAHSGKPKCIEKMIKRLGISCLQYPAYHETATEIDSILKKNSRPGLYYVAGHEHSLEYFYRNDIHYIVSGAGSKIDSPHPIPQAQLNEYLVWDAQGYFEIDFSEKKDAVWIHYGNDAGNFTDTLMVDKK